MKFKELLDSVQFEDVAPHIVQNVPGHGKFHWLVQNPF